MTQNEKTQKMPIYIFEQNCKKTEMEIFLHEFTIFDNFAFLDFLRFWHFVS